MRPSIKATRSIKSVELEGGLRNLVEETENGLGFRLRIQLVEEEGKMKLQWKIGLEQRGT